MHLQIWHNNGNQKIKKEFCWEVYKKTVRCEKMWSKFKKLKKQLKSSQKQRPNYKVLKEYYILWKYNKWRWEEEWNSQKKPQNKMKRLKWLREMWSIKKRENNQMQCMNLAKIFGFFFLKAINVFGKNFWKFSVDCMFHITEVTLTFSWMIMVFLLSRRMSLFNIKCLLSTKNTVDTLHLLLSFTYQDIHESRIWEARWSTRLNPWKPFQDSFAEEHWIDHISSLPAVLTINQSDKGWKSTLIFGF